MPCPKITFYKLIFSQQTRRRSTQEILRTGARVLLAQAGRRGRGFSEAAIGRTADGKPEGRAPPVQLPEREWGDDGIGPVQSASRVCAIERRRSPNPDRIRFPP